MNHPPRKKLLIAVREEDMPLARAVLGFDFDVVCCHTIEAAKRMLGEGIDVVVSGVHFDSGAVFELLQHVRSSSMHGKLPFFVLLDSGHRYSYSPAIIHGLKTAAKALKATEFIDLAALVEQFGRKEAVEILRRGIRDASVQQ
ncbi:hypothetical protein RY831_31055 [Noviherbaspirillum sp. CPCC 100848]|uniref:Response regulatory domain-containing protein n=1 Tax=Noviherbaspirillum album TaxID=3080276 RepID=A0ABU6JIS3_9BURK|nr:hypothetical protein [Noviherbaspirillum sp. CPCC 100848]MEC4723581.1 hypothetical protein [Noviherbaspirillum sp. CPCC 100848]